MATVQGSSLLWGRAELESFVKKTKFGIKKNDYIAWKDAQTSQVIYTIYDWKMLTMKAPSSFEELSSWTVTFSCSGHGDFGKHEIVAVPTSIPLPGTFEEGESAPPTSELN